MAKTNINKTINELLKNSEKPIILIGDGIRLSDTIDKFKLFAKKINIPILSSRYAQDIYSGEKNYFGYVGSHGTKYANRILLESDLVISLGNSLHYNKNSKTFAEITNKMFVCVDIEDHGIYMPHWKFFKYNLKDFFEDVVLEQYNYDNWINECIEFRKQYNDDDISAGVKEIAEIMLEASFDTIFVSDVGNNQLLVSRAYEYAKSKNRLIHSKTFGPCGCSLPKAIGAYYANKKPVICFAGDEGIMFNIQEMQCLTAEKLPISIVLLDNSSLGMIKDMQTRRYGETFNTTVNDGYNKPNIIKIFNAFGFKNYKYLDISKDNIPYLPVGNNCCDFVSVYSNEVKK